MSAIISSDAPLSSPLSDFAPWDHHSVADSFSLTHSHHTFPPSPPSSGTESPILASCMLKTRMSPEGCEPALCLPTHQVFNDFPTVMYTPSPEGSTVSLPAEQPHLSISINSNVVPSKRPSSTAMASSKKARACGERVTTRDFVPPDVSGLSKREARLVKNRAAAFLSRQRKREEFENMEIRVAELEQENARLLALTQNASISEQQEDVRGGLQSEVEQLRNQLAAVQQRERDLAAQFESHEASPRASSVKMESSEPQLPARSASVQSVHKGERSGASLGLMVLLCALPTLLSMPRVSTLPSAFTFPLAGSSSLPPSNPFELQNYMPGDYDWLSGVNTGSSVMDVDLDFDDKGRVATMAPTPTISPARKLEFVDNDSEALGLSGLDISFDASPTENGKIRVRIHPPASALADSPAFSSDLEDQAMLGTSDSSSASSSTRRDSSEDRLGPFLGIGTEYSTGLGRMSLDGQDELGLSSPRRTFPSLFDTSGSSLDFEYGSSSSGFSREGSPATGRRRVRIALKSMPSAGREGGEWEVEVC
ncbi:hypothetical protein SCP_0306050 [Sparassis crispa]|uniref:BZIP domain-containing protein n=1 Tax=Sparassis crispa TaxID=139825 RepID=A0A401GFI0_9APHY|nr:hypothetical protein SCP_0306050 [Sparassis crispa]GBE80885.1 hypothetical protein SCP_0306050 [Sparassis crispa]